MFKGFTSELKTKIEEYNRSSKRFIFCLSDLQESSDRGRDRYGNEEQKFDILSPELQQKLADVIGVSNPKAIKFVDASFRTNEDIFSAPSSSYPGWLKTNWVNKYGIWIAFKKKGQKKSLADLNKNNNTKTVYMPDSASSYKWEIEINTLDYFCRPKSYLTRKSFLDLPQAEGEKIEKAEKEARKKQAENITKSSNEALQEINQTLSACSMNIQTAEIDWMAVLPNWCSCEVRGISENNTLHQKHIQNCLWREESEIKAFKDKMIKAILSKGGNNFKNYKTSIIQQIIQKANQQGISETELNNNRPNWQNTLLSLNSSKEITDYQTNHLEKDIKNLVAAKSKSDQERQQAEAAARENAKKEEERLKKEQEEREKKEAEEKEKREQETKKKAEEQAKQQELNQKRDNFIIEITIALNQEPQLINSELSPQYQNWKEQVNQLTDIQQITNLQDRILADIQARQKDKKTAQEIKENLNKAKNGTKEEKKQAWENLEKQETEKGYNDNKEEVEKLKKEKAAENPQEYGKEAKEKIEEKLKNNGVKEDELSPENKKEWEKLKNGEIKDPDKLVETENKIKENIYQKEAEEKVINLTSQVNEILKLNKKDQIATVKKLLLEFISSSNIYYSIHKKTVENLLTQLENYSVSNNNQNNSLVKPKNSPLKLLIPILLIVVLVIILLIVVAKRIKKRKRMK